MTTTNSKHELTKLRWRASELLKELRQVYDRIEQLDPAHARKEAQTHYRPGLAHDTVIRRGK